MSMQRTLLLSLAVAAAALGCRDRNATPSTTGNARPVEATGATGTTAPAGAAPGYAAFASGDTTTPAGTSTPSGAGPTDDSRGTMGRDPGAPDPTGMSTDAGAGRSPSDGGAPSDAGTRGSDARGGSAGSGSAGSGSAGTGW